MDLNQFIPKEGKLSRNNYSQRDNLIDKNHRAENSHRFSEPKTRINLIKINKNKLPVDFFQNREASHKKIVSSKLLYNGDQHDSPQFYRKPQSERLHYSPQKTSFFGFFQEQSTKGQVKVSSSNKFYNRKFETRDEQKRDSFPMDPVRKLTTPNRINNNELLDLFPMQDKPISEIIVSSRTSNLKISPRKQLLSKLRQTKLVIDPQKNIGFQSQFQLQNIKKPLLALQKVANLSEGPKQQESLNITFFNAKSTCFPPINRQNL